MPNNLYQQIYQLVKQIPCGRVATYGQIAALIGKPQGARLVGWALRQSPSDVPWQRVINRGGMISIKNPKLSAKLQAMLLRREKVGVKKISGNYFINLKKFGWLS